MPLLNVVAPMSLRFKWVVSMPSNRRLPRPTMVKCLSPCKSGRAGRDGCYATILFLRRLVVLRFMNTDSRWNGSPSS